MGKVAGFALILGIGAATLAACGSDRDYGASGDAGSGGSGNSGGSNTGGSGDTGGDGSGVGGDGSGAGGDGTVPVLPEPPTVVAVTPEDGDTGAEPTGVIALEFSEGLDPDTVTAETVQILDGSTPVAGSLDYSGVTVEFTPDERLDLLGEYSVLVTTGVTDSGGTALEDEFSAAFVVRDGTWSEEIVVENSVGGLEPVLVSPVIDARGNALVVWAQRKDGEIANSVFGRTFRPGAGWGEPFGIDQTDLDCADVSVAMAPDGNAVVAWTQQDTEEQAWARRLIDGELEPTAQRLDTGTGYTLQEGTLALWTAASPSGELHVFWRLDHGAYDLWTRRATAGGDWGGVEPIISSATNLPPPGFAFDADGNGFLYFALGPSGAHSVIGLRYSADDQDWVPNSIGLDDHVPGSDDALLLEPSVAADTESGAVALFTLGEDVMATEYAEPDGHGQAFALNSSADPLSSLPKISTNGTKFVASWYQSTGVTTNVYAAVRDGGAFGSAELRGGADATAGFHGNAVSGVDRRGNALLLFDHGSGALTVDIRFARLIDATGEWTEDAPVNSLDAEYQDARIAVAANGVAVAAWSTGTNQAAESIYVSTFE